MFHEQFFSSNRRTDLFARTLVLSFQRRLSGDSREDSAAPAAERGEDARSEVPRRVDGVAAVPAERRADGDDEHVDTR